MRGFLQKRGDAWQLRVYLGADPVTGKQRYATQNAGQQAQLESAERERDDALVLLIDRLGADLASDLTSIPLGRCREVVRLRRKSNPDDGAGSAVPQ